MRNEDGVKMDYRSSLEWKIGKERIKSVRKLHGEKIYGNQLNAVNNNDAEE